jgi:hypothetical protein
LDGLSVYTRYRADPRRSAYLRRICATDTVLRDLRLLRNQESNELDQSQLEVEGRIAAVKLCELKHLEEGEQQLVSVAAARFMLTEHQETSRDCILANISVSLLAVNGSDLAAGNGAFRRYVSECCDQYTPRIAVDESHVGEVDRAITSLLLKE